eukprot:scaffold248301_cov33-Tisochrysis_lutea.AAC.1
MAPDCRLCRINFHRRRRVVSASSVRWDQGWRLAAVGASGIVRGWARMMAALCGAWLPMCVLACSAVDRRLQSNATRVPSKEGHEI